MRRVFIVIGFWLGLCAVAQADAHATPGLTVSGVGQVAVVPDMARITLGVTHRAEVAEDALSAVSQDVARILGVISAAGIAEKDLQTTGFYLRRLDNRNRPRELEDAPAGFESGNLVTVRLRDIATVGRVISKAAEAGVNDIRGISFEMQDNRALLEQARQLAVKDAMTKAQQIAGAAGVDLGKVLRINEGGGGGGRGQMLAEASSRAAPIQAGEVLTQASVTMVFEIVQE